MLESHTKVEGERESERERMQVSSPGILFLLVSRVGGLGFHKFTLYSCI